MPKWWKLQWSNAFANVSGAGKIHFPAEKQLDKHHAHACMQWICMEQKTWSFWKLLRKRGNPAYRCNPTSAEHGRNHWGSGCGGPDPPKNWMDPLIVYVAIGAGLVGVTDCPKLGIPFYFFLEKGSNTPDREVGPPTSKTRLRPGASIPPP